jgi:CRISPR system Cascade subunit CasD
MTDYLLLRLYGPLSSWGEIAVGQLRHTAPHPSRSALLGLLGAALGIERADEQGQSALASGYRFGIKIERIGLPLRDFHTVQVGVPPRNRHFRTRREELMADRVETLLSDREYRCDAISSVAVESRAGAPASLQQLASALKRPHFTLYLGRKSCPLALPLTPTHVKAPHLREALDHPFPSLLALASRQADQTWPNSDDRRYLPVTQARYYWEDGMESGMTPDYEQQRHDVPLSRTRWQFAPRREWVYLDTGDET